MLLEGSRGKPCISLLVCLPVIEGTTLPRLFGGGTSDVSCTVPNLQAEARTAALKGVLGFFQLSGTLLLGNTVFTCWETL